MSARDDLAAYAITTRTVTADDLAPLLDAYRAEVLREAYAAIEDPQQRAAVGGGLGWEAARDVVHNLLRKTTGGTP
ncbi:hypothetical protein [Streptomyces sp. NRRL S-920]|uniref:hypothetical protein n=1 Tax=Streptomyces sp. NRRL S-920 TaxID=1463921 RepID=UPI0004C6FF67|nr:hypothetical protein [Streptomyces sp. NRRL S-920]